GNLFGGHGKVAFVFAVLVVDEDDHAALADFFDGFFDGSEMGIVFSHKLLVLRFPPNDNTANGRSGSDRRRVVTYARPVTPSVMQTAQLNVGKLQRRGAPWFL